MDLPRASVTRWLVILLTGLGLVAMHSLMSVPGPGPGHLAVGASVAVSGGPAASPGHVHPAGGSVMDGSVVDGSVVDGSVMDGPVAGGDSMTGPGQRPGHHHGSMLGHLCLAVLAALGLVLLVPLLARRLRREEPSAPARPAGPGPACHPRAPPPTPTRLAQLCVSRR